MSPDREWENAMATGRTDEVLAADRRVRVKNELARRMNAIMERDRMAEEERREKAAADFIRQAPEPWLK